ncbi:PQQ-binding-like beta-propeller repeat protein [Opitutales bacterium]|nr:PQQ-binding-like beta-propeller repeat protein [Opitutales bacterium]
MKSIKDLFHVFVPALILGMICSFSIQAQSIPVSLNWKLSTNGVIFSSPAIDENGVIYVGSNDNNLTAVNSNGSIKWTFPTGNWVDSSPALSHDGTEVYVGSWDNKLYAISTTDGSEVWSYETNSYVTSSPAVGINGRIYFGSMDSIFYALENNGSKAWEYFAGQPIFSSPSIGQEGTIYFGDENGTLHAVNPDGSVKWTYEVEEVADTNKSILSSPALDASGNIYFGSGNGYCYSLSDDGEQASLNWKYQTGDRVDASPVLGSTDEVFFVSRDGYLRSLPLFSATTDNLANWEEFVGDVFYSSPVVDANGRVYVIGYTGGGENHLFAYDANGSKAWDSNVSDPPFSIDAVVDSSLLLDQNGALYFGCFDKKLYSLDLGVGRLDSHWPMFKRSNKRNGDWPSFSLSLESSPLSGGSTEGNGLFYQGTSASISATPDTGYSFSGWSGNGAVDPNAPSTTVDMSQARTLSASFSLNSYDLTVLAGSGGSVTGSGSFSHGTNPSISATPDTGYSFNGWNGEGIADPSAPSTTVDMSQARTISASFSLNSYDLTVLAESGGSVTGSGSFPHGSLVNVSATTNSGYSFVQWVGAGISDSTAPSSTLIMNSDQTITAQFTQAEQSLFSLVLQTNPQNSGILIGGGNYPQYQNVSISAEPIAGYSFDRWEGYPINNSPDSNTSLILDSNITITAHFTRINYLINLDSPGGGTVTGSGTYAFGSEANLSAEASTGYQFDYWNGTGIPDPLAPVLSLTVSQDLSLEAIFSPLPYTLTLNGSLGGSASFSGTNPFSYDSNVSITATANAGYTFIGWTGLGVTNSDASSTTVHITQDRNLTASFETVDFSLIVLQNLSNAGTVTGGGFYQAFESIPVSASINPGYQFSHWLGSGIEEPLNPQTRILLTKDSLITASFSLSEFSQYIEAVALNDSWFSSWLGSIFQSSTGWIYHWSLGWLFPQLDESGIWIWQEGLGWLWTQKEIFSQNFLWQSSIENWIYLNSEETTGPRFFDYQSNSWKEW